MNYSESATAERFRPFFMSSFPRIISIAESFAPRFFSTGASFAYPKIVFASVRTKEFTDFMFAGVPVKGPVGFPSSSTALQGVVESFFNSVFAPAKSPLFRIERNFSASPPTLSITSLALVAGVNSFSLIRLTSSKLSRSKTLEVTVIFAIGSCPNRLNLAPGFAAFALLFPFAMIKVTTGRSRGQVPSPKKVKEKIHE